MKAIGDKTFGSGTGPPAMRSDIDEMNFLCDGNFPRDGVEGIYLAADEVAVAVGGKRRITPVGNGENKDL